MFSAKGEAKKMMVQMEVGIGKGDPRTLGVIQQALVIGLQPEVEEIQGTEHLTTFIYLKDGTIRANILPEVALLQNEGVAHVTRVTPSAVNLAAHGGYKAEVQLGSVAIGNNLPCQLIAGPCAIDQHIDRIVDKLVNTHGIRLIRGGAWKPRSRAGSFTGFGKSGFEWLLKAAKQYGAEAVFTEVIDTSNLSDVVEACDKIGYAGRVVLWVGARTDNQILFQKLGSQKRFPVMVKNPIRALALSEWEKRAEWIISGEKTYGEDGRMVVDECKKQGNCEVMLCSRGIEHNGAEKRLYRFDPMHEWIGEARARYWPPVGVDPSHSAGTMVGDLVIRNLENALPHKPAFVLLETYLDGQKGLCDARQAVPLSRMSEIKKILARHNGNL
jgi:3-deoxy-D-arabino-heptulosonate 7-phosphate (DAHP) synthase